MVLNGLLGSWIVGKVMAESVVVDGVFVGERGDAVKAVTDGSAAMQMTSDWTRDFMLAGINVF